MADEEFFVLTREAIAQLRRDHEQLRHLIRNLQQTQSRSHHGQAGPLYHGTADAEIAGSTDGGLTPGIGTVTMRREKSDGTGLVEDATWQEQVRHYMTQACVAGATLHMIRDQWGRLTTVSEDCG